ncbi:H+ transporting ATP synthase O subunit [Penaeus vannamei]|uniref:Oligomycin sensitivity conferral protein n=1 Tax=Penaeus vannamei TaxID=6689 RepID=A0A3R7QVW0_PENVA|nr:H+ transporting ATP synthase O subunit [Penaeus vannamei]
MIARSFSTSVATRQLVQPPVQVFGVEGRYATALYSAAMKKKSLDAVDKDIKELSGLLKTDPQLKDFLTNPLLSKDLKKEAINSVLAKKNASPLTVNLFGALAENGRLASVDGVLNSFGIIMAAVRGEVICEVTTAKPLDAAMKKDLEASLNAFLKKGESLQLTLKVDPAIIGGMIVSIGDKYADMSMASKIKKFTSLLEQAV